LLIIRATARPRGCNTLAQAQVTAGRMRGNRPAGRAITCFPLVRAAPRRRRNILPGPRSADHQAGPERIVVNRSARIGVETGIAELAQPGLEIALARVMRNQDLADIAMKTFLLSRQKPVLFVPRCFDNHRQSPRNRYRNGHAVQQIQLFGYQEGGVARYGRVRPRPM
jgi:hypothetical protein